MNEYTLLFCILPPAAALGLILSHLQAAAAKHARESAKERRADEALAIREAKAKRDLELHEAKLAAENNKVVLQDTKLEIQLLKLKELQFKTRHMNPGAFVVTDPQPKQDNPPPVSDATPPVRN